MDDAGEPSVVVLYSIAPGEYGGQVPAIELRPERSWMALTVGEARRMAAAFSAAADALTGREDRQRPRCDAVGEFPDIGVVACRLPDGHHGDHRAELVDGPTRCEYLRCDEGQGASW